jgi:ribonuclease P/MRP protein subunit POP1
VIQGSSNSLLRKRSDDRFPPRKLKPSQSPELSSLIQQWPIHLPGSMTIFNQPTRSTATKYLETHTRGSLQKARNDLLNAGNPPTLPSSDPLIPSLLLRRDSGSWTLLLPWSWVTEFWYSIMHYPQSRFGGVTEYSQICFEKGGMAFPEDWPGTKAGNDEGMRIAAQLKEKWERRPDGKRESWGKALKGVERSEIGDPFQCDWQLLLKDEKESTNEEKGDEVEKIRARAKAAMGANSSEATTQFLLSPSYAKQLLTRTSPMTRTIDLSQALLPIRLHFLQKGNVSFRARIYRLPLHAESRQKWINLLTTPKVHKLEYPLCPEEQDFLGFVTTGNMALSEGRGRAVGALSWKRVELEEERWIDEKEYRRWCIVRDVGMDIARLAKWEVND